MACAKPRARRVIALQYTNHFEKHMLRTQNYQLLFSFERRFGGSILWIATILFVTWCYAADANTLHVPADFATIQGALDAAGPGDSILVAEGTYTENVSSGRRRSDLHLLSDPATPKPAHNRRRVCRPGGRYRSGRQRRGSPLRSRVLSLRTDFSTCPLTTEKRAPAFL